LAHTGKDYKLHFRRDLCVNCTNYKRSLAEAYELTGLIVLPPPVSANLTVPSTPAIGIGDDQPEEPLWVTEEISLGGFDISFQLRWTDYAPSPGNTLMDLDIMNSNTVRATVRVTSFASGNCIEVSTHNNIIACSNWDAAFWGTANGAMRATLGALPWSLYP